MDFDSLLRALNEHEETAFYELSDRVVVKDAQGNFYDLLNFSLAVSPAGVRFAVLQIGHGRKGYV